MSKKINGILGKVFKHRSIWIKIDENHYNTLKSFDVLLKTPWFSSPCEWFRFAFQRGLKSFKMTPFLGHSCLRKCICEERLSTENVAFWAPSIFQKLKVPDWRVSDSIDSRSNLWFSINKSMKNRRKSINDGWKPMNRWKSMKIKEILDPQTVYKGSRCQHQYTQKVSMGCGLQAAGWGHRRQAAS